MAFSIGRPVMQVPFYNKKSQDYSEEEIQKLSRHPDLVEQQDPCLKYFYQVPEIPGYLERAMKAKPMDSQSAFMPHEFGAHMNNEGCCDVETGYCLLSNGMTYAAAYIKQEGITDEMVEYFNDNFARTGNLFYKCWCPGYHLVHSQDGIIEDFGFGMQKISFDKSMDLKYVGIYEDEVLNRDPDCMFVSCNNAKGYNLEGLRQGCTDYSMIAKYHRSTDYGRELRVRLWFGANIENGSYQYNIPEGGYSVDIARITMIHIIKECCNDMKLIKQFWEEKEDGKVI